MQELGLPVRFVQENQSLSRFVGTVRGLHFQKSRPTPRQSLSAFLRAKFFRRRRRSQAKVPFVRASAILSDDDIAQLYIPPGFVHGFCTLTGDTVILYKMSSFYAPASEGGVLWNDPDLAIPCRSIPPRLSFPARTKNNRPSGDLPPLEW